MKKIQVKYIGLYLILLLVMMMFGVLVMYVLVQVFSLEATDIWRQGPKVGLIGWLMLLVLNLWKLYKRKN